MSQSPRSHFWDRIRGRSIDGKRENFKP